MNFESDDLDNAPNIEYIYVSMDAKARKALETVQRCMAAERFVILPHFTKRLDERGFFWGDVLAVVDAPGNVRFDGHDKDDRPKWLLSGTTPDEIELELLCVLDTDDRGRVTVFITIY